MKLKEVLREHKIKTFINKNKNLNISDEQLNILYRINIEDLLPKIDKLTKVEKEYVLKPLEYILNKNRENYSKDIKILEPADTLYNLIRDQLNLLEIEGFDIYNAPNLTELCLATGDESNPLYYYLLNSYASDPDKIEYINVFTENYPKWQEIFAIYDIRQRDCEKIFNIHPIYLRFFIEHKYPSSEMEVIKKFYIFRGLILLAEKHIRTINHLDSSSFSKLLDAIYKINLRIELLMTTCQQRKDVPSAYCIDSKKLEILEQIPTYLYIHLADNGTKEMLDNLYNNYESGLIEEIINTPSYHEEPLIELLEDEKFIALPSEYQKMIVERLRKIGSKEEINTYRYERKVSALIGTEEEDGLLITSEKYIEPTLDFLCQDDALKVLKEKIKAIYRVSRSLTEDEPTITYYQKYLEFLSVGLYDNKSLEEQVHQIRSRSTYFEEESFKVFIRDIEESNNKEELLKLLFTNESIGKMHQYFELAHLDFLEKFNEEILNLIISKLKNAQTPERAEEVLNFVQTSTFKEASTTLQKEIFNTYSIPGEMRKIKDSGISIKIPDYQYVEQKIEENNGEMAFINPETGIKVLIKRKNEKKLDK